MKSSHDVSNNYHQRLTLLHWCFQFLLCPSSWTKTDLTPGSLTLKRHINHILQVTCHWTLHCDWYTLHGAGNKLPYSHVPDPFPRCGKGSCHTRLPFNVCPLPWHSTHPHTHSLYTHLSSCHRERFLALLALGNVPVVHPHTLPHHRTLILHVC